MTMKIPLSASDQMMLRKPLLYFAISIIVSAALWFGVDTLRQRSQDAVTFAQGMFDQTSTSVTQIAQEEETIIRYIGRYREIVENGVIGATDRLLLLEQMGELRDRLTLYPLNIGMSEQMATRLEYDPYDPVPGEPVDLLSTEVTLSLPLLHEEDLTRLFAFLVTGTELLLPRECTMSADGGLDPDFRTLGEHLTASCSLLWYTFDLEPEVIIDGL